MSVTEVIVSQRRAGDFTTRFVRVMRICQVCEARIVVKKKGWGPSSLRHVGVEWDRRSAGHAAACTHLDAPHTKFGIRCTACGWASRWFATGDEARSDWHHHACTDPEIVVRLAVYRAVDIVRGPS